MKCKDLKEFLSAYSDGELSLIQREFIEKHLAGCIDCQKTLKQYTKVRERLGSLRGIQPSIDLKEAIMTKAREINGESLRSIKSQERRLQGLRQPAWKLAAWVALAVAVIVSLIIVPPLLDNSVAVQAEDIAVHNSYVKKAFSDEPIESSKVIKESGEFAIVEVVGRSGSLVTVNVDTNTKTVMYITIGPPQNFDDTDFQKVMQILRSDETIKSLFDRGATILSMSNNRLASTVAPLDSSQTPAIVEKQISVCFALGDELYKAEVDVINSKLLSYEESGLASVFIETLKQNTYATKTPNADIKLVSIPDIVAHTSFSPSAISRSLSMLPDNSVSDLIEPEEKNSYNLSPTLEFKLDEGQEFSPLFVIANGRPLTYLISVFVDYRQVIFEMDGKSGLLHEINIPSGTLMMIPIKLGVLSPGIHDIQLLEFKDPYNSALALDFRMSWGQTAGIQTQVIVGNSQEAGTELKVNTMSSIIEKNETFNPITGFCSLVGQSDVDASPSQRQLYVGQGKAGQSYRFQMVANNKNNDFGTSRAMVVLLDYHQISFDGISVFVASLKPNEQTLIDLDLKLSSEKGVHQIEAFAIPDPYEPFRSDTMWGGFTPRIAVIAN